MPARPGVREPGEALARLQRQGFDYFAASFDPATGLVFDVCDDPATTSIAATGFGLAAWVVGAERGWMHREDAAKRTLTLLRFLAGSDQSGRARSSGHRGFYFHYLASGTGRRARRSELSSIDTAILLAGVLLAGHYFGDADASRDDREIATLAVMLYERVDWPWMMAGSDALCLGWRPGRGFMPYHWRGYNEALLLYLLALGSPTHPVPASAYAAWTAGHAWKTLYGTRHLAAGPLFIHQLSHAWVDLRGVRDAAMRAHGSDYFENSRLATQVQQRYAVRNTRGHAHYGEHAWGLSACNGPGPARRERGGVVRHYFGYAARGVPAGPDDGTLSIAAVAASLPFAPERVEPAVAHLLALRSAVDPLAVGGTAFNPAFEGSDAAEGAVASGWVSPHRTGIDEGLMLMMIENHRSGLVWSLLRTCAPWLRGLRRAGFTGGWLDDATGPQPISASRMHAAT